MDEPVILNKCDSIEVIKEFGTVVNYYIFNEFEVHTNIIPVNTVQDWHYHNKIEEIVLVVTGEILFSWFDGYKRKDCIICEGGLVCVKKATHTFSNISTEECRCVVFRFVPDGKNKHEIIKNDKSAVDIKNVEGINNV